MIQYEEEAKQKGFSLIVGVDEAGRGPLAGPVVACAVILKDYNFKNKIADSKKLSAQQRENAFHEIYEKADIGLGIISESVIDEINILQATFLAMTCAVENLFKNKDEDVSKVCILVDGNQFKTDLPYNFKTIIGGDGKSLSIASASIIAKVTRDRILVMYDQIFPEYGFKKHKGYGTLEHRTAIQKNGPLFIHRKSFIGL